jgi:hypothetical protein
MQSSGEFTVGEKLEEGGKALTGQGVVVLDNQGEEFEGPARGPACRAEGGLGAYESADLVWGDGELRAGALVVVSWDPRGSFRVHGA